MKRARIVTGLALAAAALLGGGCDIGKIPLTPQDAIRAASPFSAATRKQLVSGPDGTTYELLVESRRAATWSEATGAFYSEFRSFCPNGRHRRMVSESPAGFLTSNEAGMATHPAGTTFRLVIACPGKPDYEFALPASLDQAAAEERVRFELTGQTGPLPRGSLVVPLFTSVERRYSDVAMVLGTFASGQMEDCPAGVEIRRIALGVYPEPESEDARRELRGQTRALLGMVIGCREAAPADAP